MAVARFGSLFAFAAFVLLLLCTLSVPIIKSINFLHVDINGTRLTAGTFGYCVRVGNADSQCTSSHLGYRIDDILDTVTGDNEKVRGAIEHGLTYALVLNPIAAGVALIAVLFGLGGPIAHICGSITAFLAFLISIVALGVNLGLFVAARHRINDNFSGSPAELGNAMWLNVAAVVCLLIAAFTICLGGLRDRKAKRYSNVQPNSAPLTAEQPSRFNFFNRRKHAYV